MTPSSETIQNIREVSKIRACDVEMSEPNDQPQPKPVKGYSRKIKPQLKFTIKRGNELIAIVTDKLRFLDVTKYLSPGMSYSKYLSAFKVEEKKSYFCYEYLDSISKLDETCLPAYEDFYSTLKNCNVFQDDGETESVGRQRYTDMQK